jgi:hypothetical protein
VGHFWLQIPGLSGSLLGANQQLVARSGAISPNMTFDSTANVVVPLNMTNLPMYVGVQIITMDLDATYGRSQ